MHRPTDTELIEALAAASPADNKYRLIGMCLHAADALRADRDGLEELRAAKHRSDVFEAALVQACADGWADGRGAFESYVVGAQSALASPATAEPGEPS